MRLIYRNVMHGLHKSLEYRIWRQMVHRCEVPGDPEYVNYGGRGIRVCERWRMSFRYFLDDVGFRPTSQHSIDRIDNNGNYEPGNVRWATLSEQGRNKRTNVLLTFAGRTMCVTAWAEEIGIKGNTLTARIRNGWSVERALTVPLRRWA